jgi:HPt (histidine-containing phosphotransfer) domain-containing protein
MHLNIAAIRDYTGTDDAFIVKLFDKFLEHIRSDISKLKESTLKANWDDVKSSSHVMLSSARIFALEQHVILHEQIERNCINNTPENIPEMVGELAKLYEEVIAEMNELKKAL